MNKKILLKIIRNKFSDEETKILTLGAILGTVITAIVFLIIVNL